MNMSIKVRAAQGVVLDLAKSMKRIGGLSL